METEAQRIASQWGVLYLPNGEKNDDVISAIQQALNLSEHPKQVFSKEDINKAIDFGFEKCKTYGDITKPERYEFINSLHPTQVEPKDDVAVELPSRASYDSRDLGTYIFAKDFYVENTIPFIKGDIYPVYRYSYPRLIMYLTAKVIILKQKQK